MSVLIGSIPNDKKDDVKLAKKLSKVNFYKKSTSLEELEAYFSEIFEDRSLFMFNRGRDSLYFLLKSLNIKREEEVIVQAFTCVATVSPILWVHAKPVYVDIDKETYNMDISKLKKAITPKTRVIIVQHTFGNIADVYKVREIVDEINKKREEYKKISIIEDCCHLFYLTSQELEEKYIGIFSDAFFFSFAQDKAISCTQGSVCVVNNTKMFGKRKTEYANIPELSKEDAKYNAKYIVTWNKIRKWYFVKVLPFIKNDKFTIGKFLILYYRERGDIKKQADNSTIYYDGIHKLSHIQASLLLHQLDKLEDLNEHRLILEDIYNKELKKQFRFKKENGSILLRYPVIVNNIEEVREHLKKKKIIIGKWYSTPIFPLEYDELEKVFYKKGLCPNAESCGKKIINLPLSIDTTEEDAKNIVSIINKFAKQ